MSDTQPRETVERALELSEADGAVVILSERTEANLRWANNTLTTNGSMRTRSLSVISVIDGVEGVAVGGTTRSAVTPEKIEALVRASEKAARDAGPAEDPAPLIEPVAGQSGSAGWDEPPAETSIAVFDRFAPALSDAFARSRAGDRLLFGYAEHSMVTTYLGSSTGLRLRHDQPTGVVEMNAKSTDFARSVWTGASSRDFTDVDALALHDELVPRLEWEKRRIDLPAGRYDTILPPAAVADLMLYTYISAGAKNADQGRTVFGKAGGGSRMGERLTDVPLNLRGDPAEPGLECSPFLAVAASHELGSVFDNGAATPPVSWIDGGVLSTLPRTRGWAAVDGAAPAMFVDNLIMDSESGTGSVDDLIANTERGLLLTCLWYIRVVDPRNLLLTGLTRDGVYLVENGEVAGAVTNYRFNESPVEMLGRVTGVGRTERCLAREFGEYFSRTAMPALRVADFNMSTVSQAS